MVGGKLDGPDTAPGMPVDYLGLEQPLMVSASALPWDPLTLPMEGSIPASANCLVLQRPLEARLRSLIGMMDEFALSDRPLLVQRLLQAIKHEVRPYPRTTSLLVRSNA